MTRSPSNQVRWLAIGFSVQRRESQKATIRRICCGRKRHKSSAQVARVTDKPISRTPPAKIRRILRQEVDFGCPVSGCGSPFLTWHHFDPPWHVCHHHNPEGMVALCLQHHKEAGANAFTKSQLQALKRNPYLRDGKPRAKFNWQRQMILFEVGSNYYLSPDHILRSAGNDIIQVSRNTSGLQALSLDLRTANGDPILKMKANDWVMLGEVEDVECPPSANALIIRILKEGIRLNLRFRSLTEAGLRERIIQRCTEFIWKPIHEAISEWPVAVCTIESTLVWPVSVKLASGRTASTQGNVVSCCFKLGGGLTIHKDGGITF